MIWNSKNKLFPAPERNAEQIELWLVVLDVSQMSSLPIKAAM